MTQKQGSQVAVGLLSGLFVCFFSYFYLRLLCGLLARHAFGAAIPLAVFWVALPLLGLLLSFWLAKKPQYPALPAPEGLPAYANADTYADSTVTFYPEPQDCHEPPRTPPEPPETKAPYASMSFLLGLVGCITPFAGFIAGCVAIALACKCRTAKKDNRKKDWEADCRRRAIAGFILGICACLGQFVLIGIAGTL